MQQILSYSIFVSLIAVCTSPAISAGEFAPFAAPLKPTVICSVSSCNDVFTALEKISVFAGSQAEFLRVQTEFQEKYGTVLDFSRPMGFVLLSDGEMFYPLFFLPIQKESEDQPNDGVQLLHDRLLQDHLQRTQAELQRYEAEFAAGTLGAGSASRDVNAEKPQLLPEDEGEVGEPGERPLFFFDLSAHVEPGEIVLMPDGEKRMLLDQYVYPWPFGSLWGVQKGDWVYIAVEELLLPSKESSGQVLWSGLPEDPSILLDRLNEKCLLAGRFDFSGSSRELFNGLLISYNMLVHAIDPNEVQSEYRDLFRGFGKYSRSVVNEVETFDRGLKFDPATGNASLITSVRAVPDSALARYIGANKRPQSVFGSFLREDGSFYFVLSEELTPPQRSIGLAVSRIFRNDFLEHIRKTNLELPDEPMPPEVNPESVENRTEPVTPVEPLEPVERLLGEEPPATSPDESGGYAFSDDPGDFVIIDAYDELCEYDMMPDRMTIIFGEPFANGYRNFFQYSRDWVFENFGERTAQPLLDFIELNLRHGKVDAAFSRSKDGVLLGAIRLSEGEKIEGLLEHVKEYLQERKVAGKSAGEIQIRTGEHAGFTLSKLTLHTALQNRPTTVPPSQNETIATAEKSLLHELGRKKPEEGKANETIVTEITSPTAPSVHFAVRADMLCFAAGPDAIAQRSLHEALDTVEKPVQLSGRRFFLTATELERFLLPRCPNEQSAKLLRQMIANQSASKVSYEIELSNNEIARELKIDGPLLGILAWFLLQRE